VRYPVMTEKHVADRWQVSLKTLRRWRIDGEGPVWHKLFRHVRYHDADVLEFEHSSAQHLMTLLGIKRDFKPEAPEAAQGLYAKAEDNYFTAKEIAEAASISIHLFRDQAERNRKRVPHLMLVGTSGFRCQRSWNGRWPTAWWAAENRERKTAESASGTSTLGGAYTRRQGAKPRQRWGNRQKNPNRIRVVISHYGSRRLTKC